MLVKYLAQSNYKERCHILVFIALSYLLSTTYLYLYYNTSLYYNVSIFVCRMHTCISSFLSPSVPRNLRLTD